MRTAYFDCFSGISGDMCLGVLVSAGVPLGRLKRELGKAPLSGYRLSSRKVRRAGVEAIKVDVGLTEKGEKVLKYRDISKIVRESRLSPSVKERGLRILKSMFEAEALVHGGAYTKVHLHELGATDALVDVLGTLICLEALGIERVAASPLNLGGGTVATSHGELPVPTPATLRLLEGAPVYSSGHPYELTTPTGAAIIAGVASAFGDMPLMRLEGAGAGAGGRNLRGKPNVLRVLIGETLASEEEVAVVETNIDDMDPRLYEDVTEKLFGAGALDVFLTNILMKKGRPAVKLTVLCEERIRPRLSEIILRETTTLGVRHFRAGRTVLQRKTGKVETRLGPVRVKVASMDGAVKAMPEYEDLRRAARRHGVPISEVAAEVARKFKK